MKKQGLHSPVSGFTHRVEFPIYETLKLIQEGLCVSEIARYRHVSRNAIYKILSTLNKKGFIRHPKYSVYELTNKGIQGLHSFVGLRYKLRQHNLHFKIKVLESTKNWALKRNEMRQFPYFNKTLKLKNNEQDLFNYGRLSVKTTSKSIIIKIPTIYATNWENAIIQAMDILEGAIYKIEKAFKVLLIKNYKSNITIISQEYARIQDSLAKLYRQEKNRLYITGEDGKIWMITDFSFSTDETEFIHPDKATDDVDSIAPFLNDLRDNPTTMTEIKDTIGEVAAIQKSEAQNIVKHQAVLDKIMVKSENLDAIPTLMVMVEKLNKRLEVAGL